MDTTRRLIARAQAIVGSADQLADQVQASTRDIEAWIAGNSEPPWPAFERALTIILNDYECRAPLSALAPDTRAKATIR
jgi:hypothetical protein